MRLAVLLNSLYTGGAEYSTLSFYGWLVKEGHEVILICCKEAIPSYNPIDFGIKETNILKGKSFLCQLIELNRMVVAFKPQLIHSVLFEANMLGRACRLFNRKVIHLESLVNEMYSSKRYADQGITRFKLKGYQLLDWITQWKGVDHFHANGNAVAKHYQDKLGIASSRITIIPRGRPKNPFVGNKDTRQKIRNEFNVGDKILLVNAARHEYQKGQDILIQAIANMGNQKENVLLVIAGREGKLTAALKKAIDRHQLPVILAGHRTDLASLLSASDVFVFPSRYEGLPGALIEAEAAGLAVICSDILNNREVVEENINAFFYPVDDHLSLSRYILQLCDNDSLRKQMGLQSLHIFEHKFLLDEICQRMLKMIEKLLQTGSVPDNMQGHGT